MNNMKIDSKLTVCANGNTRSPSFFPTYVVSTAK